MGRREIVNEIHRNKDFFCEKWVEFCQWVMDCGKQLEKYRNFQEQEELDEKYNAAIKADDKKAVNHLRKSIDKKKVEYKQIEPKMEKRLWELKEKSWYRTSDTNVRYLDLPRKGDFPTPPDAVDPLSWLFDEWSPRQPNQSEQLLLDCALLCVTHDAGVPERKRIYLQRTYKGKYFECDKFCNDLQRKLDDMDKNGDLQQAWDDVKPNVKAETKQKEIVEVKPGVYGITLDIKELARRFWKWVCFRGKD